MRRPEIRITGTKVTLWDEDHELATSSVGRFIAELTWESPKPPRCGIIPSGVRLWYERRDIVGVAVEIPHHCRTIRWLAKDSPSPFGPGAKFSRYFVALPYIVLLLVFYKTSLTHISQLYYRCEPLDSDGPLLLPNLRNVAPAYGLQSWVCLMNLGSLSHLSWPARINAIVKHVLVGGFNLSGEIHVGNSYWTIMHGLDPRISSIESWEEATRQNPRFILEVSWKEADTTAARELQKMMGEVSSRPRFRTASDIARVVTRAATG